MNSLVVRLLAVLLFMGGLLESQEPPKEDGKLKVAILAFSGVEILDFAGPAEVFGACRDANDHRLFEVYTVGVSKEPIESMHFVSINPKYDPTDAPEPDVLVIPGGNVDSVMSNKSLMDWISKQHARKCILFSVCNGASVLAKLGVLEGLDVATHHSNRDILQWLEPKAKCVRDKRFIDHGQVITTAGVSAGIDGNAARLSRKLLFSFRPFFLQVGIFLMSTFYFARFSSTRSSSQWCLSD
ncbi:MAG: DJ-1/PfpI family protein [Planctomycetaceae bacterium]|nr:DJ-1/PfpI family protein [Planctomycetaceae bacterium]